MDEEYLDTKLIDLDDETICRGCLDSASEMRSLFEPNNNVDKQLCTLINNFTDLNIFEGDGLPSQMCTTCISDAVKCYKFKQQLVQTNIILIENLAAGNTLQDVEVDSEEFFEIIDEVVEEDEEEEIKISYSIVDGDVDDDGEVEVGEEFNEVENENADIEEMSTSNQSVENAKLESSESEVDALEMKKATECEDHPLILWKHLFSKDFKCNLCSDQFESDKRLRGHKKKVHGILKPFECTDCDKVFQHKFAMTQHMRIHTGEKPYECDLCGKQFRYMNVLKIHKQYHTDERPFPCIECGKSFKERTHLRKHLLIHTDEKPHECEFCGRRYRERSSYNTHRKTHTEKSSHKITKPRPKVKPITAVKA